MIGNTNAIVKQSGGNKISLVEKCGATYDGYGTGYTFGIDTDQVVLEDLNPHILSLFEGIRFPVAQDDPDNTEYILAKACVPLANPVFTGESGETIIENLIEIELTAGFSWYESPYQVQVSVGILGTYFTGYIELTHSSNLGNCTLTVNYDQVVQAIEGSTLGSLCVSDIVRVYGAPNDVHYDETPLTGEEEFFDFFTLWIPCRVAGGAS